MKELDNRGSTFYIALHWAEAMRSRDPSFGALATALRDNEQKIAAELLACQVGQHVSARTAARTACTRRREHTGTPARNTRTHAQRYM